MQRDGPAPPSPNDCITKRSLRHSARKFSHVQAALSSAAGVGPRRGGGSKVHRTRSLKKKKRGSTVLASVAPFSGYASKPRLPRQRHDGWCGGNALC